MIKIIVFGLIAHALFLASIFQIYFQSPVITGLHAQSNLNDSPAKRLVLFVADGLRAESFFRDNLDRTPFLRNIILNEGIHGISHTRVPTESRPGHVALIAGFYEDPSAVLKGWQHNPIDFDSVFNRSDTTYAWGSPDILSIFTKRSSNNIVASAYTSEIEDFSGKTSTTKLDTWVFDKVIEFLRRSSQQIVDKKHTVFFLHLLGLDTAGHVHKPNTELFDENLKEVDKGISKIVSLFNGLFSDGKTAFIFTSDHGMTNKGSHGAGTNHETETPIVAWGAGVNCWKKLTHPDNKAETLINDVNVPRFDIKQADLTPLMSSLIGTAVPTNNLGKLPAQYLNVSEEYIFRSVHQNTIQIANQFKHLQKEYKKAFLFKDFHQLNEVDLLSIEYEIQSAIKEKTYSKAIKLSYHYIDLALDGIHYFQTYYQNLLLLTVSIAMIGWMFSLYQQLDMDSSDDQNRKNSVKSHLNIIGLIALIGLFAYLQNMSIANGIFLILPVFCWYPVKTFNMLRQLTKFETWFWIGGIEFLVLSFFNRIFLSGLLLALLAYEYYVLKDKKEKLEAFFRWALNCAILAIYPILPLVDKDSNNVFLLTIGLGAWGLKIFYAATSDRNPFKIANLVIFAIGAMDCLLIVYDLNERKGLNDFNQFFAWILSVASFILPTIAPNSFRDRLMAIISSLALPFCMMSLSYEPLFYMTFTSNIYYWVSMIYTDRKQMYTQQIEQTDCERSIEPVDFKRAFICIIYVLVSFFGTGNIASVSSFDPNWVRCFVSTFSPFLMASLIILKLLIPVLIVMCAIRQIHSITKIPLDKFFILILLCCDIMCLNFLFLVKNTGSWLEIGTSISHFVIMETTVVVLCLVQVFAKFLTTYQLQSLFGCGKTRDLSADTVKIE
ncbi:GPI ethanolamine phosphate transferase 1 isoform X2 [Contarinia nasturtii]|uniref:GPI ethanolamine phosphate transferase 1 isoform X2 n=1 Tax=Contarinia nasturtii TaxID=265458 RepID=UPI0012D3FA2D|nr:GPI ethanolamine phosphate transferase 1 isoform X2 [Contarinia nasturtii]